MCQVFWAYQEDQGKTMKCSHGCHDLPTSIWPIYFEFSEFSKHARERLSITEFF